MKRNYHEYYKPENFYGINALQKQFTIAYMKYKDKFDFGLKLFVESENLKDIISREKIYTNEQRAVSFIFINSQNLQISVLKLLNKGIRIAAGILLRSLYESYINTKYIIKNEKGTQFINYRIAARKAFNEANEKYISDEDLLNNAEYIEFKENLSRLFEEVKSLFTDSKGRIISRWIKKDLWSMASDVGEELSYDYIYRTYSAYVHCNIDSMYEYRLKENDDKEIYDNSPSLIGIDEILDLSSNTFGMITTECAGIFEVDIPDVFRRYLIKEK